MTFVINETDKNHSVYLFYNYNLTTNMLKRNNRKEFLK